MTSLFAEWLSLAQLMHRPAQGRLRHSEPGGGAGETALLGHGREDRELVIAFDGHFYAPVINSLRLCHRYD